MTRPGTTTWILRVLLDRLLSHTMILTQMHMVLPHPSITATRTRKGRNDLPHRPNPLPVPDVGAAAGCPPATIPLIAKTPAEGGGVAGGRTIVVVVAVVAGDVGKNIEYRPTPDPVGIPSMTHAPPVPYRQRPSPLPAQRDNMLTARPSPPTWAV